MRPWSPWRLLSLLLSAGLVVFGLGGSFLAPQCRAEGVLGPAGTINPENERALEQELLRLTNQYRMRQGLSPLIPDEALNQIAREHSTGMAAQGFISHHLPSGDPATRLAKAGYPHEVVRENVASAPTVQTAQNALIQSPGHEKNILAEDVTRIGIGIVRCPTPYEKELYITEIFANPRGELREADVHDMLLNRLGDLQSEDGPVSLRRDPVLENLASRTVQALSIPYSKDDLKRLLADSAGEIQSESRPRISQLGMDVQLLYNPKSLRVPNTTRKGNIAAFGSAVRKVTDNKNQPALLVLTLIGYTSN